MTRICRIFCLFISALLLSSPELPAQEDSTAFAPDEPEVVSGLQDGTAWEPGQDSLALRKHITALCAKALAGRGYVGRGMYKAQQYIAGQFDAAGLQSFPGGRTQSYHYSVNTFPGIADVKLNGRTLKPGEDFLVYPASSGYMAEGLHFSLKDGYAFARKAAGKSKKPGGAERAWRKWIGSKTGKGYAALLLHTDTIARLMQWDNEKALLQHLPEGVFLLAGQGKPVWSVAGTALPATVVTLYDSSITFRKQDKLDVTVQNKFIEKFPAANVIGYVPGTVYPDSFIVLTAHYDHLGKMGSRAMFPGASDNASGTAMLLRLAAYYAVHPQRFSIAFMAFSGEEAGLLGSRYYTAHPVFPLEQIRFLVNLDIMGDASEGITVVNGSLQPAAFALLQQLNTEGHYLPAVKSRGAAANSDHYPFSEKGVPAFFWYANGGPGYYHDIWDKAANVSLKNIVATAELLQLFLTRLQE